VIKVKPLLIIVLSLSVLFVDVGADTLRNKMRYPLPVAETEVVIARWLSDSGLTLSRTSRESGSVLLQARGEDEKWQILLSPYSPLVSLVNVDYTASGQSGHDKIDSLKTFIDGYVSNYSERHYYESTSPGSEIHAALSIHAHDVVCIRAERSKPVESSGFIIGSDGLVISTAHDLEGTRQVTVIFESGKQLEGQVIKIDQQRDLSLIDIDMNISSSISLGKSRFILELGDPVYSIGCRDKNGVRIQSGIVNRKLGIAGDLPLWQVNMEVLHGSSGSPVFDAQGNLAGVVKGRYRGDDRRGFLITLQTVIEFLKG
jgi:serine protease Do